MTATTIFSGTFGNENSFWRLFGTDGRDGARDGARGARDGAGDDTGGIRDGRRDDSCTIFVFSLFLLSSK